MSCLTVSELYIKKIQNLTRSVKLGSKKPSEVAIEISNNLEKLKPINEGRYNDLMNEHKDVVNEWKIKNTND